MLVQCLFHSGKIECIFLPKMKHLTALASADRAIILMALPDQVLRPILEFFHGAAISRAKIVSEKLVPESSERWIISMFLHQENADWVALLH